MRPLRVAKRRGDETISVMFFEGDDKEAPQLSVDTHIKHGLPLSPGARRARGRSSRTLAIHRPPWADSFGPDARDGGDPEAGPGVENDLFR